MGVAYVIIHKDHPLQVTGVNSGAEMATLSVAKFLARKGHTVYVAGILEGLSKDVETIGSIQFINCGKAYDVSKALAYVEAQESAYHCIAAGKALPLLLSASSTSCKKRVFISQDRAVTDSGVSPSVLNSNTDAVICVSQAQKDLFLKEGFDDAKVHIVHNGIDTDLFRPADDHLRDYSRIVFSGALVPDKGIQLLIPAFQRLKTEIPSITLDVYGSAALWGRESFFDEKEVERSVPGIRFHGAVPQKTIAAALATAGLSVVPSIWFDPFPLVAMEAQGAGCPVIGFAAGGIPEGIVDGETGLVVEDLTEAGLYQAMKSLLQAPERLARMSKAASERIHKLFTWEHFATAVVGLCETLSERKNDMEDKSIGIVTTWNESCGLATYAQYLLAALGDSVPVFASGKRQAGDGPRVKRCWDQKAHDYSALRESILESGVQHVLFNCQVRFFNYPAITECIHKLQEKGVCVSVLLHSTFTLDEDCRALATAADGVIVHSLQNRLRLLAHGVDADRVFVLPHGVQQAPVIRKQERDSVLAKYKLPVDKDLLLSFGFIQAHKGMEAVIEAVQYMHARGRIVHGLIVGSTRTDDPSSVQYLRALEDEILRLGLSHAVSIVDSYVPEHDLQCLMQAASCIIMNYQSQYFEASGASSLAVASGTPVLTSSAPAFQAFGDAVWQATSGFPIPLSVELLLSNKQLADELRNNAIRYQETHSWNAVARSLKTILAQLKSKEGNVVAEVAPPVVEIESSATRVLFQNRANVYTQPGGDTRIMDSLASGLKLRGIHVDIDCDQKKNPADYDLVHLFNFATPDITEGYAKRAHQANTPYVVTTLCEDVPLFHTQSHAYAGILKEYVQKGQPSGWYDQTSSVMMPPARSERFKNDWVVAHAAKLMTTGRRESVVIQRDYKDCPAAKIAIVPLGTPFTAIEGPELFTEKYGVSDFVLSVGRLESRKNQLMLLKALEDSDLPIVLVTGGFSYQPDYVEAIQAFKRRGKTIICDRLSDEMLASAYAAARVHVLCSWYELPGLVSLEAAARNCNVVVTPNGTAPDYFGDAAFYATPQDAASIRNAIMAAYYSPVNELLQEVVGSYQWDRTIDETLSVYDEVLGSLTFEKGAVRNATSSRLPGAELSEPVVKQKVPVVAHNAVSASDSSRFMELLEQGEQAAREKDFVKAEELLNDAEKLNAQSFRLLKAKGAIAFAQGHLDKAIALFKRALTIEPNNPKGLSGMGMCEMAQKKPEAAYPRFVQALEQDVTHGATMLQLIECAYILNRFDDLIRLLERYVQQFPDDPDMRFCYAGALYKAGRVADAKREVDATLKRKADHRGATELLERLEEESSKAQENSMASADSGQAPQSLQDVVKQLEQSAQQLGSVLRKEETSNQSLKSDTSIDEDIQALEQLKKRKEYETLAHGCQAMLHEKQLSSEQRDHVELLLAEAGVLQGSIRSSEVVFDRVLQRNQSHPRALCGKGALECFRGNYDSAGVLFEQARSISPTYDVALAGLGVVASQQNDKEKAWDFFGKALDQNPENSRALYGVVELAYPLNRLDKLEDMLQRFLERQPDNIDCRYSLAGCQFAQGHRDDALQSLEHILSTAPTDERALELKAHIQQTVGDVTSSH